MLNFSLLFRLWVGVKDGEGWGYEVISSSAAARCQYRSFLYVLNEITWHYCGTQHYSTGATEGLPPHA